MKDVRFLFFKWKKPVIRNKQVIYHLLRDVEEIIFGNSADEDDMVFLSFIEPAGLLKRIFAEREKRKRAKENLRKKLVENQVSVAVTNAIAAARVVAASAVATMAATSAATS